LRCASLYRRSCSPFGLRDALRDTRRGAPGTLNAGRGGRAGLLQRHARCKKDRQPVAECSRAQAVGGFDDRCPCCFARHTSVRLAANASLACFAALRVRASYGQLARQLNTALLAVVSTAFEFCQSTCPATSRVAGVAATVLLAPNANDSFGEFTLIEST